MHRNEELQICLLFLFFASTCMSLAASNKRTQDFSDISKLCSGSSRAQASPFPCNGMICDLCEFNIATFKI
jgi:hypothetical protein